MLPVVVFLQENVGARGEEGVRRLLRRDGQDGVVVLGAEAAGEIEDVAGLANRLSKVAQCIGELLEATGVLRDVHVPPDKVVILDLQVDSTMQFIVT